jgi:hypothetical protein
MAIPVMTGTGLVFVSYHQLWIAEPGSETSFDEAGSNGIVAIVPGAAAVITGIHTGNVTVSAEVYEERPTADLAEWEIAAEFTLWSHDGELAVNAFMADAPDSLPALAAFGPGGYRIRVHGAGRDTAPDLSLDLSEERYLVQAWPTTGDEFDPVNILKSDDQFGARR